MERGGVEEERDRDRIVLESENYIILGQILNSETTLILGWSEYICILAWAGQPCWGN